MVYFTPEFKADYNCDWIEACTSLHIDPLLYIDLSGVILGCNDRLLDFLHLSDFDEMSELGEWFVPQGLEISFIVANSGDYRGKIYHNSTSYDVLVKSEHIVLGDKPIVGVVFKDISILEKARAAERYFETLKNQFLSNISHEFRTPMNSIIGFTDLLKNSPLSSWQSEYISMMGKSAMSMMRNIENLLELMQVESGGVHLNLQSVNPIEVFERFSMLFDDLASSKKIDLLFLIDPRLPKIMIADEDKILAVIRNLIQNSIKFTSDGGSVFVEITLTKDEPDAIEVEYSVSDTGIGIEPERVKMLLRPFASAWDNQRRGKDGLGIGLSLSHKYIDMMGSHLMLASEVDRGSRFSFRLTHEVEERASFEVNSDVAISIYTQKSTLGVHGALLYKYLEVLELEATVVNDLVSDVIRDSDVLFLDAEHISKTQIDALKTAYPELDIIPIIYSKDILFAQELERDSISSLLLPLLPTSLLKALSGSCEAISQSHIVESSKSKDLADFKDVKVLVAEDNIINLRLLETILHQEGFKVTAVDNGQKAVDAYLKEYFNIVLMDIDMPVMDGLMANRLIKEIDKRDNRGAVPVIALTAHALIGDRERIIAAGLDAHLAKPIDKKLLLQTISRFMNSKDKNRAK